MLNLAVAGLAGGGAYALIGVCLVLSYRVGAVINFSQTFVATLATYEMTSLVDRGINQWVAILLALILSGVLSGLQGWLMARFFSDATVLVRSTVTIGMAISVFALTVRIFKDEVRNFPSLFDDLGFAIGSVTVAGPVVVAVGLAIAIAGAIALVLGRTRLGVILRAVSARPTTAELMGVRTTRLIILVWAVAGVLTCLACILVAPNRRSIPNLSLLVIPGLAAGIFGSMRSFPLTLVGGMLIGMLESMALNWGAIGQFRPALSFVMVTAVLMWSQRKETWGESR